MYYSHYKNQPTLNACTHDEAVLTDLQVCINCRKIILTDVLV